MANLGFERAWEKLGGQLMRTPVGDQHVQAAMWQTGAMLGGEQSGHVLCHHHSVSGDGIQTALHLTYLVQAAGVPLSELIDASFQTYPQLLKNVRVESRDRRLNWQECDALTTGIKKAETAMGNKGRVLVRASGTEPVMRVMVEAEEQYLADYWARHLVNIVEANFV
jgi:phosphoglucosamine mutase